MELFESVFDDFVVFFELGVFGFLYHPLGAEDLLSYPFDVSLGYAYGLEELLMIHGSSTRYLVLQTQL